MKRLYYDDEIEKRIDTLDEVIIYGAGVMGQALKLCLEARPYDKKVSNFIVSQTAGNPEMIGDAPVIAVDEADRYKDRTIIVALNEGNMPGAIKTLNEKGFRDLMLLNAAGDEWSHIKANFFLCNPEYCYIPFRMIGRGNHT